MKLSEQLKQDHECGDFGKALDGYAERAEALERDAERYRWLRHGDNDEPLLEFSLEARCGTDDVWLLRNEELDAAIDSALKTPNVESTTKCRITRNPVQYSSGRDRLRGLRGGAFRSISVFLHSIFQP